MDAILGQARARIQHLRAKVAKLTAEADELAADVQAIEAAEQSRERLSAMFTPDSNGRGPNQTDIILDGAEAILTEAGHRLRLSELVARLAERNIHVGGKSPENTLSAKLSTDKARFDPGGMLGWGLVAWKKEEQPEEKTNTRPDPFAAFRKTDQEPESIPATEGSGMA